jgi:hypothetical protein
LPENKGGLWSKRSLIFGLLLLIASICFASIYVFSFAHKHHPKQAAFSKIPPIHHATPKEKALSWKTEFGQFAPYTDAERELEKMLHGKDEDIDLALANWLIVADVPEFHDLTREAYFAQLDAMTDQVRERMAGMQAKGWPNSDSDNPETRCQRFCSAILDLHCAYAEEFREENLTSAQMKALYANPDNIFLAGLMRTKRGSCVSLPMLYLVIGQRLGMPVHLVSVGKHSWIRWDEPRFRMNIETTAEKIAWTPDESVYLDTEGMTRDQVEGTDLQDLSNRQVIAELFFVRRGHWDTLDGECEAQSCIDLERASTG